MILPRRPLAAAMLGLICVFTLLLLLGSAAVGAQDEEPTEDEQTLVEKFAPVLAVRAQDEPCDTSGEQYTPTRAENVLDNPHVLLRQDGVNDPVVMRAPGASDIFDMGAAFFIDFPGDAFNPGCIYEDDFLRYSVDQNTAVYAHIARQDGEPDKLAVQYWFFYYYNKYNNLHEGDWEGIQLMFDVGSVAEALETTPTSVGYSQHFGGEIAMWGDDKLELVDTHPVVYPALGSHASYFESTLYLGRSGSQGFGCDTTVDAERRLDPDVILLPDSVSDRNDPLAWMMFEGLWGEQRFGPFSGATGPITKPRWTEPVDWHETLRDSSVAVPDGDETTTPFINQFCTVVGFGSRQYLIAQQNPLRTSLIVAAIAAVLWFLTGRTDWNPVNPLPIVRRRRLGQIVTSSLRFYASNWKTLGLVGLMFLPLSLVAVGTGALLNLVLSPLGVTGSALSAVVRGALQIVATIAVAAAGTEVVRRRQDGETVTVTEAYRAVANRLHELVATTARAVLIVGGLAITIVGIPWAIRQYVRYQVAVPALMIEGRSGADALHRSSELIHGRKRWWHTAVVVLSIQSLVALVGAVSGLVFLIAANGLPLELYSFITTVAGALILPYSAITTTLLFGNVVADIAGTSEIADLPEEVDV